MKILNRPQITYSSIFQQQRKPSVAQQNREQSFSSTDANFAPQSLNFKPSFKAISYYEKIESDKKKLLNQLNEILDSEPENLSDDELVFKILNQITAFYRRLTGETQKITERLESFTNSKPAFSQANYNELSSIKKKLRSLEKLCESPKIQFFSPQKKSNANYDYVLANKLKTALLENNYNLDRICTDYYKLLENTKTIDELKEFYPKIKLPQNPQEVVAKKFVSVLTRDFYEKIDKFCVQNKQKEMTDAIMDKIEELWRQSLKKNPQLIGYVINKTSVPIVKTILDNYVELKKEEKIKSVPINRKDKFPQITNNDLSLLLVDFEDFVLYTVKQHYLYNKNLNEIVYETDKLKLPLNFIKDNDYKFQKQSEKIKSIIKTAQQIKKNERKYEKYDDESFKVRLNYYACTPISSDDGIFEKIVDFSGCKFAPQDKINLQKFLEELDKIYDGEKTTKQALETIKNENISPIGTELLNKMEKINAEIRLKKEQKITEQLNKLKSEFDDSMNFLYLNNLNNLVQICSKYRPERLGKDDIQNARFVINTIKKESTPKKLESAIIRWNSYKYYKKHYSQSSMFKKAVEFATELNGTVNEDKAGKYIINAELVETYPNSLSAVKNPEIFKIIMNKESENKDSAIKLLCKYDNYENLQNDEKNTLRKILTIFDIKNSSEKAVLKNIIENDYCNADTFSILKTNSSANIKTCFSKEAKKQILDKYKFPVCLEFLEGFENAIKTLANKQGSSGIKHFNKKNKSLQYTMEVKLIGHNDRLFSSKNDYNFDIFSEIGLH